MNMIERYSFGCIRIGGQTFNSDVIVWPDRVEGNWWRLEGHKLQLPDIQHVIDSKPRVLVIGTGASGMMQVTDEVEQAAQQAGIRLVVETTDRACQTYNQLLAEGETDVVAALHLTC